MSPSRSQSMAFATWAQVLAFIGSGLATATLKAVAGRQMLPARLKIAIVMIVGIDLAHDCTLKGAMQ